MATCGSTAMNTHGVFTPAAVVSPKYDKTRTGKTSSSLSAGAEWGDRHCPLLHRISALYFIVEQKEFTERYLLYFFLIAASGIPDYCN